MTSNALVATLKEKAPELAPRGEEIGRQIREAIAETRSLSHGLAPATLLEDGLVASLGALAENTRHAGLRCVLECPGPATANPEASAQLYRIAQEAVNNAVKHARASEIRIGLEREGPALTLEVEDDGEGLEEPLINKDGIGLRVMRYRAQLLGGTLEIGSPPAGGTRIRCRVPACS
jgi:signal transduction histidine kinase